MNPAVAREHVIEALSRVINPELGRNLVDLGMVRDVRMEDGSVQPTLALTTMACPLRTPTWPTPRAPPSPPSPQWQTCRWNWSR